MTKIALKDNISETNSSKPTYRLTNWSQYNQSLKQRGSLSLWLEESILDQWFYEGAHQRGGKLVYSDACITCLLQLKVVFDLKYRQLEGFASSIFALMGINLPIPSYTQISRRCQTISVDIKAPKTKGAIHIVVDSTGLKVYGEGEWKVRKHGYSKRRTWRKLHLAVDESTGLVHAHVLTGNQAGDGDSQQVKDLLDQIESPVGHFSGDGAYDTVDVWETLQKQEVEGIIPPQRNAVYWKDKQGDLLNHPRNHILEQIDKKGRKQWKQDSNYHRRSLSETAMYRFKTIYGGELYARKMESQQAEVAVKIRCLNIMTGTGMPCTKVAA